MSNANAELSLIARQHHQLLDQMNSMRGDMAALTAVLMRLDGTVAELVQEMRAVRAPEDRQKVRNWKRAKNGDVSTVWREVYSRIVVVD